MVVKVPQRRIFPSDCNSISLTTLLALGLKVVSRSPVEETLAIRLRVTPQTVTKVPQRRIFPSS
jgi:hypothetical protein